MATITTRAGKGSPLTNTEVDDNFTNLNTDKAELSGATFTGNVGIGTSPARALHVSSGTTNEVARFESTDTACLVEFKDTTGTASIETRNDFRFNAGGSEAMRITSSGNVGIATTNPVSKLHVQGSTGSVGFNYGTSTSPERGNLWYDTDGTSWQFNIGKVQSGSFTPQVTVQTSGNVGIGETNPADKLQVTDGAVRIKSIFPRIYFEDTNQNSDYSIMNSDGSFSIYDDTNAVYRMRIDSSGNVGIGTISPSEALHIANGGLLIDSNIPDAPASGTSGFIVDYFDKQTRFWSRGDATTAGGYQFKILENDGGSQADAMVIDSSGNVGIGTSSPASEVDISKASGGDSALSLTSTGVQRHQIIQKGTGDGSLVFYNQTANAERMRIDSSGNVLVGTTTLDVANQTGSVTGVRIAAVGNIQAASQGIAAYFNRLDSDGTIAEFRKDGTTVGSIGSASSGYSLYIHAGDAGLKFEPLADDIKPCTTNGANRDGAIDLGDSAARFKDLYLSGTGYVGSLLVGTTADVTSTNAGVQLRADNTMRIAKADGAAQSLYRLNSNGDIINFYKDGSSIGSIGARASTAVYIDSKGTTGTAGLDIDVAIAPRKDGALSDGQIDLGTSAYRFDDIYATNATIQTSDRNEKQDIAELSDAEQRVAVAVKGLLRKFRWRDAVEEKGDEARIHFGIIAQDLQNAFTAEGLDAGDYAMFINSTWTDEETGEERSRMGVRYSELLAFIISAI